MGEVATGLVTTVPVGLAEFLRMNFRAALRSVVLVSTMDCTAVPINPGSGGKGAADTGNCPREWPSGC